MQLLMDRCFRSEPEVLCPCDLGFPPCQPNHDLGRRFSGLSSQESGNRKRGIL